MLFAGKKYARHPDRIYRTGALKLRAMCDDVLDALALIILDRP